MNRMMQIIALQALEGEGADRTDARLVVSDDVPLEEVLYWASQVRKNRSGNKAELCAIVNARSGACSEDCRYCAQSAHYNTEVDSYELMDPDALFEKAKEVKATGATCFGIVTSGPTVTPEELKNIAVAITKIQSEVGLQCSASLGKLSAEDFAMLKNAGMKLYHHNLETSEKFFPAVCTSHSWSERYDTIRDAHNAGLAVCSGGLFGLGEDWSDRIDLAMTCANLKVESVPLNFLHPIPGTPMENTPPLTPSDILRTIALFRFCLPNAAIRICGGRERNLRDLQSQIFAAGADGMMVGNYLTRTGRKIEDDHQMLTDLGLEIASERS